MQPLDPDRAELGEGPLWLPARQVWLWFDILGRRLLLHEGGATRAVALPEMASAAAIIDRNRVMISTESGLRPLALDGGALGPLAVPIAADQPGLRSNDGRADPWGGFWVSTMGKTAEEGAGAIRRWFAGELRVVRPGVTIPNAICFDRARACAYYADTRLATVWRHALDPASGWPVGEAAPFLQLRAAGLSPDGAVVAADGSVWIAMWGAGRVIGYDPQGRRVGEVAVPARQVTCPALGGPDLGTLLVTTAQEGMSPAARHAEPAAGLTFIAPAHVIGLPETPLRLS